MVFPLLRQSAGVMEWWSNGVMKKPIQLKLGFSLLPTLQYSSSPVLRNSSQSLPAKPFNADLALRTRFSLLNGVYFQDLSLTSVRIGLAGLVSLPTNPIG